MAGTFEALAVVLFAVLPGGSYVWGFERQLGSWGSGVSDRILRLIGASAAIHALAAPLSYWLWASLIEPGRLARGESVSWLYWVVPIGYVGLPWAVGALCGWAAREHGLLGRLLPFRSPRAWDALWAYPDLHGWVRVRLKNGTWVGGAFGREFANGPPAHASRYPEPGDLWLAPKLVLDEAGNMARAATPLFLDEHAGVLVRWEEVAYLEFAAGRAEERR